MDTATKVSTIGIILGSFISLLTLYFTWKQLRLVTEAHVIHKGHFNESGTDHLNDDEKTLAGDNTPSREMEKAKSPSKMRLRISGLIGVAIITFIGTTIACTELVKALHKSTTADVTLGYRYLGCFQDTPQRVLNGSYSGANNAMLVCAARCKVDGFRYFGSEAGYQCFCDNVWSDTNVKVDDSHCNYTCMGDAKEECGGIWYISVGEIV